MGVDEQSEVIFFDPSRDVASEMTYIVSSGTLNSTPTNQPVYVSFQPNL